MTLRPRPCAGRPDPEQGIALITSLLVMLVCSIVVVGVLQLADHSIQRSGLSRDRNGALNAAQAGIQAELSLIADGSCPTVAQAETPLPDQKLPTESYIIQRPVSCTANGAAVIAATGYVPNATKATSTVTVVAHINRSQGAPVSGGANGGYDFPDALYSDGNIQATAGTLNLYGTGGAIPNITGDNVSVGASGITGSQLGGRVNGQVLATQTAAGHGVVNVFASQIGGGVTGTNLTLTGPTTNPATTLTVQGPAAATRDVTLTNTTVNGTLNYGGTYTHPNSSVSGAISSVPATLPLGRPLGKFDNTPTTTANTGTALGVGTSPALSCPGSPTTWTSSFYDIPTGCAGGYAPSTYSPAAANGNTVIIVQGPITITIPPTAVGGQLYVVGVGGASITIVGTGSTLPVFAFTDGAVNLSGTFVGQVAGHSITVTGASTTMSFSAPVTPMPNISFPVGYTAPNLAAGPAPYISTVAFQYQCSGTAAC